MRYFNSTRFQELRQTIAGYVTLTKQFLDQGWQGYLMTMMFNQLRGNPRQKNHQMQGEVQGVYGSLLTRTNRRPRRSPESNPILIASPDWPVPKRQKMTLSEVATNDGLHYHAVLLVPAVSRLRVSVPQHFTEQQDYYLRDGVLQRIDVRPFGAVDSSVVVDYALKGLQDDRLPNDESLLILPKSHIEIGRRSYVQRPSSEFPIRFPIHLSETN